MNLGKSFIETENSLSVTEEIQISIGNVRLEELEPFFSGWTWTPTVEARTALVEKSDIVVAARMGKNLIGIATALTDGGFFAYLSYLEVLPQAQGHGVAKKLVEKVVEMVKDQYDIATITDSETVAFYEKVGFTNNVSGVHLRFLPKNKE